MAESALSVDQLTKTFHLGFLGALPAVGRHFTAAIRAKVIARRVEAVSSITFGVPRGHVFGFLGPNGAGKTTTIKMLAGLIRPTSGSGTLLGRPIGDRQARARLGFLPEQPYFHEYLKPLEFLDFYGALFRLTAQERRKRAEALIDRVGLRHAIDRPIRKFSKGMVQRIGIAQALINDPDLLILDEPMSGLDPIGRKEVRDIIFDLKSAGKTVFFSSHILQDVEMICDQVAILIGGRLQAQGPLSELLAEPTHAVEVVVGGLDDALLAELGALAGGSRQMRDCTAFTLGDPDCLNAFIDKVRAGGGELVSVTHQRRSLEDLFVAEVGG